MDDDPKAIKMIKVEFVGSWRQGHPEPQSGVIKYSCDNGGKIKITTPNGNVEEHQIAKNRAALIVNDIIHFPYAN